MISIKISQDLIIHKEINWSSLNREQLEKSYWTLRALNNDLNYMISIIKGRLGGLPAEDEIVQENANKQHSRGRRIIPASEVVFKDENKKRGINIY